MKDKEIEIQERIAITQEDVDKIIKYYEKMPDTFGIGILGTSLDKKGVIREIKKLSEVGKAILLIDYNFNKYMEKEEKKSKLTKKNQRINGNNK